MGLCGQGLPGSWKESLGSPPKSAQCAGANPFLRFADRFGFENNVTESFKASRALQKLF
jgi:hypothetical protein